MLAELTELVELVEVDVGPRNASLVMGSDTNLRQHSLALRPTLAGFAAEFAVVVWALTMSATATQLPGCGKSTGRIATKMHHTRTLSNLVSYFVFWIARVKTFGQIDLCI